MPIIISFDQLRAACGGEEFAFKRDPPEAATTDCLQCAFLTPDRAAVCDGAESGQCVPKYRRDGQCGRWILIPVDGGRPYG